MKKIVFIFVLCIFTQATQAQFSNVLHDTILGGSNVDRFSSIQRNPIDSTIVVCGHTKSLIPGNNGDFDGWIVKFNPTGDTLWSLAVGTIHSEFLESIVILPDGDYIAIGGYSPFIGAEPIGSHGSNDAIMVKVSKDGILLWYRYVGGSSVDIANKIILGPSGTCIIVGETLSSDGDFQNCIPYGSIDSFIMSINTTDGSVLSVKNFGGTDQDRLKDIITSSDGVSYLLTGWTMSNIAGNHSSQADMWILKVDVSTFSVIWQLCVGTQTEELAISIIEASSGDIFIGGCIVPNSSNLFGDVQSSDLRGGKDALIAKITSTGSLLWVKTFGGSLDDYELHLQKNPYTQKLFAFGLTISSDMQVPGNMGYSDTWFFIFNEIDGTLIDTLLCGSGGYDQVSGMISLLDDNFIAIGTYSPPTFVPQWDGYIVYTSTSFQPRIIQTVTGVMDNQRDVGDISVSPNPSLGIMQIGIPTGQIQLSTITIHNLLGDVLFSGQTTESSYMCDLTTFSSGIYLVKVQNGARFFQKKVQKL